MIKKYWRAFKTFLDSFDCHEHVYEWEYDVWKHFKEFVTSKDFWDYVIVILVILFFMYVFYPFFRELLHALLEGLK